MLRHNAPRMGGAGVGGQGKWDGGHRGVGQQGGGGVGRQEAIGHVAGLNAAAI